MDDKALVPAWTALLARWACLITLATLLPLSSLLAADAQAAQELSTKSETTPAPLSKTVETFTPPKRKSTVSPRYPKRYQKSGHEGWATVSMMVDSAGKPYDLRVIGSSGDPGFEKEALRVVPKWRFEPAQLGSTKIDAAFVFNVSFWLSGATGASRSFIKRYNKLSKAIQSDDQVRAEELLADMKASSRTLYERAYWQLSKYLYEKKWGTEEAAYQAVRRAAHQDNGKGFLPPETLVSLLATKLDLELETSRYARAKKTAQDILDREVDEELQEQLAKILQDINGLVAAEGIIALPGRIDDSNYFYHQLLRRKFGFRNVSGDIAELRLHCDKGYVGFIYDEKLSYSVDPNYRDCGLTAIGTPGTTFELVEFAAEP